MSSKQAILRQVRKNAPPATELPSLEENWIRFDDPCAQFMVAVEQVGGQVIRVKDHSALNGCLEGLEFYQQADKVVSLLVEVGRADVLLGDVDRPHALEDVDVTIAAGQLAVAENGAVWVSGAGLAHRAVLFLCQHLVLVVPSRTVVHNLHEAYDRLTGLVDLKEGAGQDESRQQESGQATHLASNSYGLFISGPSKTADIEQALVIGAQGPRSLTVLLVD
jgi:L-lactate dehydrogenase complex protein LldG